MKSWGTHSTHSTYERLFRGHLVTEMFMPLLRNPNAQWSFHINLCPGLITFYYLTFHHLRVARVKQPGESVGGTEMGRSRQRLDHVGIL